MPTYTYRCPECGRAVGMMRPIADRDRAPACGDVAMQRVPDAPAFTVEGFNAKNRYSKETP